MTATATGVGLIGIDGVLVEVQVARQVGLPGMDITGLPAASIREARFRVRSALRVASYEWPRERLLANFAPADLPKGGTAYDLPLALAILALDGVISKSSLQGGVFCGELALDGAVRPVSGAINAALAARQAGRRRLFVASSVAAEAAAVPEVEVYGVTDLVSLVETLNGRQSIPPATPPELGPAPQHAVDLLSVRGQLRARRALEVAAAGGHNLLMVGPPGCGKTLLARTLPTILPALTLEESLEVTRIHSAAGLRRGGQALIRRPPFRAPHATASYAALVGGGNPPRPGEVSLAHHGVLFLDEAAEFRRHSLDSMRAPLEDRRVQISRAGRSLRLPASFGLVCAMNPCPCGHRGDRTRPCHCPPSKIEAYRQRLSGPLLDRIDIRVEMAAVMPDELAQRPTGESSATVRKRVVAARRIQTARNRRKGRPVTNAGLDIAGVEKFASLGPAECRYLARAGRLLGLSARAWHRVVRVARTIADLAGEEAIGCRHLAEALTYRVASPTHRGGGATTLDTEAGADLR